MSKEEFEKLVQFAESKSNGDSGALDEAVIDAKCSEASDINNSGFDGQVEYLCEGLTFEQGKALIEKELG